MNTVGRLSQVPSALARKFGSPGYVPAGGSQMQRIAGAPQYRAPVKQPEVARAANPTGAATATTTATATHNSSTQRSAQKQNMANSPVSNVAQPVQRKRKVSFRVQERVEETRNGQSDEGSEYEPEEITAKRRKTVKKIAKNKPHGTCGNKTKPSNNKKAGGPSNISPNMDTLRTVEESKDTDESGGMKGAEVMQVSHLLNAEGGGIAEMIQVNAPLAPKSQGRTENNSVAVHNDTPDQAVQLVDQHGTRAQNIGILNIGTQNVGTQNVGTQNVGTQNVGTQNVGTQNVGTQNVGIQDTGTQKFDTLSIIDVTTSSVATDSQKGRVQTHDTLVHKPMIPQNMLTRVETHGTPTTDSVAALPKTKAMPEAVPDLDKTSKSPFFHGDTLDITRPIDQYDGSHSALKGPKIRDCRFPPRHSKSDCLMGINRHQIMEPSCGRVPEAHYAWSADSATFADVTVRAQFALKADRLIAGSLSVKESPTEIDIRARLQKMNREYSVIEEIERSRPAPDAGTATWAGCADWAIYAREADEAFYAVEVGEKLEGSE